MNWIDESAKPIKPGSKDSQNKSFYLDNYHKSTKWTAVGNVLSFLWMLALGESYPNEPPMTESVIAYANRYLTK